ncbi:hypothetical protein Bca4012_067632 [Brassica carinata]
MQPSIANKHIVLKKPITIMSLSHLSIMCFIMISLVPLYQLGNADGLEFKRKCINFVRWVPAYRRSNTKP